MPYPIYLSLSFLIPSLTRGEGRTGGCAAPYAIGPARKGGGDYGMR